MTEALEIAIFLFLVAYGLRAWRRTPLQVAKRNRRDLRRSLGVIR